MLKILANENVLRASVDRLRASGHDVAWVSELSPGATDQFVIELANREARLLLTFDKDFGEFAAKGGCQRHAGIILLRLSTPNPVIATERIVSVLESRSDWHGHFSVIDDHRIRMIPLST